MGVGRGERQGLVRLTRLICFGTYNIWNGRNWGFETSLRGMSQDNMYLVLLQETNITKRIYTCESSGYKVVATEAPSVHSGGVSVFYRTVDHLSIKGIHTYRANIVSF